MPKLKNARSRIQEQKLMNQSGDDDSDTSKRPIKRITTGGTGATGVRNRRTGSKKFRGPPVSKKKESSSVAPISTSGSSISAGPPGQNTGLDWDWVATLDQDPTGKDYFPEPFDPPEDLQNTGLDIHMPNLDMTDAKEEFSIWALAKIRNTRYTNAVASMLADPKVKVKWALHMNTFMKNRTWQHRSTCWGSGTNHEAVYAAMCGVVLPPERWCEKCKTRKTSFTFCIVLPGYLSGACVGCHYHNGGSRCSHRPNAKTRFIASIPQVTPALSSTSTLSSSCTQSGGMSTPTLPGGERAVAQRRCIPGCSSEAALRDIQGLMLTALGRVEEELGGKQT